MNKEKTIIEINNALLNEKSYEFLFNIDNEEWEYVFQPVRGIQNKLLFSVYVKTPMGNGKVKRHYGTYFNLEITLENIRKVVERITTPLPF